MRILFLDDSEARHRRFRTSRIGHHVVAAFTAAEAVDHLAGERFDQVWLDHDLSELASMGAPAADEPTGYDVARHVAGMPEDRRPGLVVVHSLNPVGAARMAAVLRDAGQAHVVRPFVVS